MSDSAKNLSKANILDKITPFDIFTCYCTGFTAIGKRFKSELRDDKNPTCSVFCYGNTIFYKDFSESGSLSCFDYVMRKYSLSFVEAMQKINIDFSLNLESLIFVDEVSETKFTKSNFDIRTLPQYILSIRVCIRNWDLKDKEFWNGKYYLTSNDLRKYNICPLSGYYINNIYTECGSNVYGYYFGKSEDGYELWKIYQPYACKEEKWRTNCPEYIIQGLQQLEDIGETLIITKSLKDVVVINSCQYSTIAPQSETNNLSEGFIEKLKTRFQEIVILYDNDQPGITAAKKLSEIHNLRTIFMPDTSKDASDFIELYGKEVLKNYLKDIL